MKDVDLESLSKDKIDVGINHTWLTRADVEKIHEAGLTVNCWTVDTRFRAMQLVSWGVDYITSNIIE
jgi:glycerophosphoryl diester phosphodiesterase